MIISKVLNIIIDGAVSDPGDGGTDPWGFTPGFIKNIFGDLWPTKTIEGATTSIFGLVFNIILCIWPSLLLLTLVVIAVGVIKWVSSQGVEQKVVSARKWIKNAVIGFITLILIFIITVIVTKLAGIDNVFQLSDAFTFCGENEESLLEYKQDLKESAQCCDYKCSSGKWVLSGCDPEGCSK